MWKPTTPKFKAQDNHLVLMYNFELSVSKHTNETNIYTFVTAGHKHRLKKMPQRNDLQP